MRKTITFFVYLLILPAIQGQPATDSLNNKLE